MLYIVRLSCTLGIDLARRGEFRVGGSDLGLAVAGSCRLGQSRRSHHQCLLIDTTGSDPHLCILEGPHEVADIFREFQRGIDMLPMQDISLEGRSQQGILHSQRHPTYMVHFPNRMPTYHHDEVPGNVTGSHHEMALDHHQVIGHCTQDSCLHDVR